MRATSIRELFIVVTLITAATFTILAAQGRKMLSQRLSYQIEVILTIRISHQLISIRYNWVLHQLIMSDGF